MGTREQLKAHGLRVTETRVAVLGLIQKSPRALSQQDVEQALPSGADRVTLFRVLKDLEEAGLAHRVLDSKGVSCYAACSTGCTSETHHDAHAHFRCVDCGSVYCLEPVTLPKVRVPRGFRITGGHLDLEGHCAGCA